MDATTLSGLIVTNLTASFGISDPAELQKLADAVAQAVVTHIQAAAVVTVSGVEPGAGSANGTVA